MPNDLLCTVPWCDQECRWEFETDGLSAAETIDDLAVQAHYLAGFGHPPFRWHSRLWPSGICVEQNEFSPDTDPLYVAEHGQLIIRGANFPTPSDAYWTKNDLDCVTRLAVAAAQLAGDLIEAATLAREAPHCAGSGTGTA